MHSAQITRGDKVQEEEEQDHEVINLHFLISAATGSLTSGIGLYGASFLNKP